MGKLSPRQVAWIICQLNKGKSVYQIAKKRKVCRQWIRKIRAIYQKTGEIPVFKSRGRKASITAEEKTLVIDAWKEYPLSALSLQNYLMIKQKKKISHNKIHKILKDSGYAKNEPKKQKRRKWVRFERRHSNTMWHVDWTEIKGKQVIIFEDDASRFITGYGVFDNALLENALTVFLKAVKKYGLPKQLLSDNGSQFRFNERFDAPLDIENKFQKTLKELKVKQIFTRPHHPQTNGKLERLNHTIVHHLKHFGTIAKSVEFYNFKRPHMSLNWEELETPYQAFLRKRRK